MNTLSRRTVLTSLTSICLLPEAAVAQDQALTILYPFPAGGSGDAIARMVAVHLQKSLGRPVVVENRTGAGGRIGVQAVKEAPPDGATLLFTATGQLAIQPHVTVNPGYDPFADLVQISEVASSEIALAVNSQVPARALVELATWLKAHPDQATFASPGSGTSAYFSGTEFARAFGVTLRHVGYRGTPAALPDVLAGRVPVLLSMTAELLPHHRAGGIQILATAGSGRSPFLPDTPTLKESGVNLEAPNGFSFHAPSRTPVQIVNRFEKEIIAATQSPEVKAKILSLGLQPTGTTGAELKRILRVQFDTWGTVVQASGFKPE